jgi:Arc/MetJ family transcription regulator
MRCMVIHMTRTNIDIDDQLVEIVMVRYHLTTKREAVDYALRHLAGQPMSKEDALAMFGSMPDFEVPQSSFDHDWHDDRSR